MTTDKSLNAIGDHAIDLINQYYFLFGLDLLPPGHDSEIFKSLYETVSRHNLTHYNPDINIELTPQFRDNRCWFEYLPHKMPARQLSLSIRSFEKRKTLVCIFKQLLIDLKRHGREYKLGSSDSRMQTPYYLLVDLLEYVNKY